MVMKHVHSIQRKISHQLCYISSRILEDHNIFRFYIELFKYVNIETQLVYQTESQMWTFHIKNYIRFNQVLGISHYMYPI